MESSGMSRISHTSGDTAQRPKRRFLGCFPVPFSSGRIPSGAIELNRKFSALTDQEGPMQRMAPGGCKSRRRKTYRFFVVLPTGPISPACGGDGLSSPAVENPVFLSFAFRTRRSPFFNFFRWLLQVSERPSQRNRGS